MTNDRNANADRKLGTLAGVFIPNVLTILGVIMFMRTGWVVGYAGLPAALLILLIAKSITILTSLSLSSVSTNTRVGAGGAYFLISRSLGPEVGGSIGIPLYFAQAISVAFYLVGFSESLQLLMPAWDERVVSAVALAIIVVVTWFGASVVARAQYVILALLIASLGSIFTGFHFVSDWTAQTPTAFTETIGFWAVFAVFFPAVTGIMAGVSMSGDLRSPSRSIPVGTIGSVLVTLVIYAALMFWVARSADRQSLQEDSLIFLKIASVPQLVYVGLWAATLSSALASLAAAPRTLKALADDRIVPRILGRSFGSTEPRLAILLSAAVAGGCIAIGDLDLIAPIITMFFLATYGTVNLVAGIESLVGNPSYRPTFRTHWSLSLLGGIACVGVMLLINWAATLVASVVISGIYIVVSRRTVDASWADMRSGLWFTLMRFGLLRFVASRQHLRNWRPVLLVLVGNPNSRLAMLRFAHGMESGRGFLFLAQILTGQWEGLLARQRKIQDALRSFIRDNQLSAVPNTVIAEDFEHGVATLLQVTGIGEFQPNTVLVGWSDDVLKRDGFAGAIRRVLELERNLIVFEEAEEESIDRLRPTIDVWWYARDNGSFMATLAYLLNTNSEWRNHTTRVLRIIRDQGGAEEAKAGTEEVLADLRIQAEVMVLVSTDPPMEVIARTSEYASVCFVGISVGGADGNPLEPYTDLIGRLRGNVLLTKNWHDLSL